LWYAWPIPMNALPFTISSNELPSFEFFSQIAPEGTNFTISELPNQPPPTPPPEAQERVATSPSSMMNSQDDREFAWRLVVSELQQDKLEKEKQVRQDELFAKLIEKEERRQFQYAQDHALAVRLDATENQGDGGGPAYRKSHVIEVHNQHCGCGNNQTWNNNHIFDAHDANCGCALLYQFWNRGHTHIHDHRCCTRFHFHSTHCLCVYRNHAHTAACCTLDHVHNRYCHCTHK